MKQKSLIKELDTYNNFLNCEYIKMLYLFMGNIDETQSITGMLKRKLIVPINEIHYSKLRG